MAFNESNSVEHYILHQLTGVNLNAPGAKEPEVRYSTQWQYQSPEKLDRGVNEVLVEPELKAALLRLNPEISQVPERAEEVIYKLRAIILSVNQVGLVRANEEFFKWMTGEKTMPFGENNRHVPVRLIDFDDIGNNSYIATNQYRIHHRETKIPDIVLIINGLPVVIGEAKTPIRPSISWLDGAHEVHEVYENSVPALFVPNILSFATEGKELYFGAVRSKVGNLRLEGADQIGGGIDDIGTEAEDGIVAPPEVLRKFGGVRVEADTEQGIVLLSGVGEHSGKGHTASLCLSDGRNRENLSGSKQVCRLR